MCYSNSLSASLNHLENAYRKDTSQLENFSPVYLVSGFAFPVWPVITTEPSFIPMRWGLIPSWFRGIKPNDFANKTLNARIESLNEKASFKHLVTQKRCVIPSTGFYENQQVDAHKKPFFIFPNKGPFFHMAGLYDTWIDVATRDVYFGFTIITTQANSLMAEIHNTKKRMPLLLENEQYQEYLYGDKAINTYKPLAETSMGCHPISKRIFTSENNNFPSVQQRVDDNIGTQGLLF